MTKPPVLSTVIDEDDPTFTTAREQVLGWLDDHDRAVGVVFAQQGFAMTASVEGRSVGGLIGSTNLGWLHVSLLAVAPEARRSGVGRMLLNAAESRARERGCHGAWLNTFEHQGPEYYPRLGWEKFGELPDFPKGSCRRFYRKSL